MKINITCSRFLHFFFCLNCVDKSRLPFFFLSLQQKNKSTYKHTYTVQKRTYGGVEKTKSNHEKPRGNETTIYGVLYDFFRRFKGGVCINFLRTLISWTWSKISPLKKRNHYQHELAEEFSDFKVVTASQHRQLEELGVLPQKRTISTDDRVNWVESRFYWSLIIPGFYYTVSVNESPRSHYRTIFRHEPEIWFIIY